MKIQIVATVLAFVFIALYFIDKVFADDTYQMGRESYEIIQKIDNRFIVGKDSDGKYSILDLNLWNKKKYDLSEIIDEIEILDFDDRYICITGVVGVHAKELIVIEKKTFEPVQILDDLVIISDAPKFELFNCEKIDKCKVAAYNRDYDKDPLVDMTSVIYYYKDGEFIK